MLLFMEVKPSYIGYQKILFIMLWSAIFIIVAVFLSAVVHRRYA